MADDIIESPTIKVERHIYVPLFGSDSIEDDLHYLLDKATKKALDNIEITKEEKLESILSSILDVIKRFRDCNSAEEFRTLAKRGDGTLATITMMDPSSGFLLYKTIGLGLKDYKKFYFETLGYALAYYLLFYRNNEFDIISEDDKSKTGKFRITDESLPHLLGLENKFVSNKECPLLNKIIPGYNNLSILDKIHSLVFNYDKIIQYEDDHNIDIFNYYKNMQKNKDFLLMGRFVPDSDLTDDMYKVHAVPHNNNQVILYKKSNNNSTMNSSISKLLLQQLDNGNYFPRSMQRVSVNMLEEDEAKKILEKGISIVESDYSIEVKADYPEDNSPLNKPSITFHFAPIEGEDIFLRAFEDVLPLAGPPEEDDNVVELKNDESIYDSKDIFEESFDVDKELINEILNSSSYKKEITTLEELGIFINGRLSNSCEMKKAK